VQFEVRGHGLYVENLQEGDIKGPAGSPVEVGKSAVYIKNEKFHGFMSTTVETIIYDGNSRKSRGGGGNFAGP
jgi:hypothetical protein